jgi:hypothetical protein
MQALRRYAKPLCWLLALAMVNLSLPYHAAWAAMLPSETVIEGSPADGAGADGSGVRPSDRDRILALLQRDEVRAQLEAYGVGPAEARARVESLSDREIARIAARLGEEPAGGVSGLAVLAFAGLLDPGRDRDRLLDPHGRRRGHGPGDRRERQANSRRQERRQGGKRAQGPLTPQGSGATPAAGFRLAAVGICLGVRYSLLRFKILYLIKAPA